MIKAKQKEKRIVWLTRYSSTMEDDAYGRWARVAYAGELENDGFSDGKVCRWDIAWVNKLVIPEGIKFTVRYLYPSDGKVLFDNLEDAQKEVEETFQWFINVCK